MLIFIYPTGGVGQVPQKRITEVFYMKKIPDKLVFWTNPITGLHLSFGEIEFLLNSGSNNINIYDDIQQIAIVHINLEDDAYNHLASLMVEAYEAENPHRTIGFALELMFENSFKIGFNKSRKNPWMEVSDLGEDDFAVLPQYHESVTPLNKAIKDIVKKCFLVGFTVAKANSNMDIHEQMPQFDPADYK